MWLCRCVEQAPGTVIRIATVLRIDVRDKGAVGEATVEKQVGAGSAGRAWNMVSIFVKLRTKAHSDAARFGV